MESLEHRIIESRFRNRDIQAMRPYLLANDFHYPILGHRCDSDFLNHCRQTDRYEFSELVFVLIFERRSKTVFSFMLETPPLEMQVRCTHDWLGYIDVIPRLIEGCEINIPDSVTIQAPRSGVEAVLNGVSKAAHPSTDCDPRLC